MVFKGGTSLSKAFALIERFSEDVDVLVVLSPEDTKGARDRILKHLVRGAADDTSIEPASVPGATSTGSKRGARFHYQPEGEPGAGGLTPGVFLELGSSGGAMPSTVMEVMSLVAQHAHEAISGAPEAEPVEVRVLDPSRTLVEKLILLHTAHSAEDPAAAIRGARHFYDVHQLLARPEIVGGIHEHGITILARDVCTYSRAAEREAADRPNDGGFSASPAFNDGPHVAAARADFEGTVLTQLLWPDANRPTFDECVAAVHDHRDHL